MILGIDGCPAGWCCATLSEGELKLSVHATLMAVFETHAPFERAWIDIPIGLADKLTKRTLEAQMRAILKPVRHSSVFTPPARPAVYASGYERAQAINRTIAGQSISIQTWNINSKIIETDNLLRSGKINKNSIFEAHPEMCFYYLNHQTHLTWKKSARQNKGVLERINLLQNYDQRVSASYDQAIAFYPRTQVQSHDFTDALCLAVCAQLALQHGDSYLQNQPETDQLGLPMRIAFFDPGNKLS